TKVLEAIKRLGTNPFGPPPKIKKLKGKGVGQWRLEVWPYRVRYDVVGHDVVLYRVRHRKDIYRSR
ncbi:type II toxin-antitoxin system RelE/ParE family toxin, partial [Candidatus Parcubacteria bacterium]|nr:type II toxin-antitoxin system RelE/ParE family toxin [Candidatus Parcubacteria bacterium]